MCAMPRTFRAVLALLIASVGCQAPSAPSHSRERPPNVVFVVVDELGYYELSCLGNPRLRTPNIDRMAAEGMRFTQAMAGSAVCAPTRACLMTGKHSGHTSVRTNGGGTPLRAEEITVANLLHDRGYATGGFGKWGCGGRGSTGVPEQHGFDVFLGYYDQVHAHSYYPAYLVRNSEEVPLEGNVGGRSGETYSHYVIVDAARDFIRAHRDQPFFCYMPITPPHGMIDIPDHDPAWAAFAKEPWPEEARRYAAMVAMVDRQIGELFALLRELKIDDDTLVIVSGDNGGADYFASREHPRGIFGANVDPHGGAEFRGKKGELYEGGLRIPMLIRWPGKVAAGVVSDQLCYFPDMLPTLAELTGARVPEDIDGISIVPTLLGADRAGRPQPQHEFLYWEIDGQTAIRAGDWKAYRARPKADWELYDLATDIAEAHDLAAQHPERVAELSRLATAAHVPVREGTFADTALHERDRAAKWGPAGPPGSSATQPVAAWPTDGLIPTQGWRILRVSSESKANGKLAANAIDGDPRTHWHTQFQGEVKGPPHELVIDLGAPRAIAGFRYLARQDGGWNGAIADCEIAVSDDPDTFGEPVVRTRLRKVRTAQDLRCAPVTARYLRLRALSEVNGGPWASVAEFGVIAR